MDLYGFSYVILKALFFSLAAASSEMSQGLVGC